jgi:hypothetical protein
MALLRLQTSLRELLETVELSFCAGFKRKLRGDGELCVERSIVRGCFSSTWACTCACVYAMQQDRTE